MKINFTKLLTISAIVFNLIFWGISARAQGIIYDQNFDGDLTSIQLPSDWSSNFSDSTWVLDSSKQNVDTSKHYGTHFNMFFDANATHPIGVHKNVDVIATYKGISVAKYKDIKVIWAEKYSSSWYASGHTVNFEYSIDGGKKWDTIPHTRDMTGAAGWALTNGGTAIALPKTDHASNLMVRWVGHSNNGAGGNYQFGDFSITGTLTTGVADEVENVKLNTWVANDLLNINLDRDAIVYIYNLNGQLVTQQICHSGMAQLNISGLKPGIYLERVSGMDFNYKTKFIK